MYVLTVTFFVYFSSRLFLFVHFFCTKVSSSPVLSCNLSLNCCKVLQYTGLIIIITFTLSNIIYDPYKRINFTFSALNYMWFCCYYHHHLLNYKFDFCYYYYFIIIIIQMLNSTALYYVHFLFNFFYFLHSCSLGNWPLGCWVHKQINKKWTDLNYRYH
jgi:hypothetical protein